MVQRIREGRFQRALAAVAALSAALSGAEVTYEHYRGSYGQQVMYTPVILSGALMIAGLGATISRRAARWALPAVSILVIVDGLVGFAFHVRGVARKPGGWRVPIVNLVMGPPIFAPVLFALSGYLGLIASYLRRPDDHALDMGLVGRLPDVGLHGGRGPSRLLPAGITRAGITLEHQVREGRFQQNIAVIAGLSALFSGIEATYSHYQNRFEYRKLQWSPILLAPALCAAGLATVSHPRSGRTILPILSAAAVLDGILGAYFHLRGVLCRPGGVRMPLYNVIYGPPIFAPLLLAASGFMGGLASLLRRAG